MFGKSIDNDAYIPNGHNQLGRLYVRQRKWDRAEDEFRRAIQLVPDWSNYYVNLSEALDGAGKHAEAIAELYTAIGIYDHNERACLLLINKHGEQSLKCRASVPVVARGKR